MPEPESLGSILSRERVPGPRKKKQRLDLLKVNWEHIAGKRLAEHSEPTRIARGTLTIAADGPAWAAEVSIATRQILARTREIAGDDVVGKLRVRSRGTEEPSRQERWARTADEGQSAELSPIEGRIGEEIASVEDEKTRNALARLVRASRPSKQTEQSEEREQQG